VQAPPGCSRYDVELRRPLGLVLEERATGDIVVAEVQASGHAEKVGSISIGDVLISTSAYIYTRESRYGEATVKSGETRVILNTRGEVWSAHHFHTGLCIPTFLLLYFFELLGQHRFQARQHVVVRMYSGDVVLATPRTGCFQAFSPWQDARF
jgi:hypothetical protein